MKRSRLSIAIRILLAAAVFAALFSIADPGKVLTVLLESEIRQVLLGIGLIYVAFAFRALRWRGILNRLDQQLGWATLGVWTLGAQLLNFLVPTSIGGDIGRWIVHRRENIPKTETGVTLLLDRLLGSTGLYPLVLILAFSPLPPIIMERLRNPVWPVVIAIALTTVTFTVFWRLIGSGALQGRLTQLYQRLLPSGESGGSISELDERLGVVTKKIHGNGLPSWIRLLAISTTAQFFFLLSEWALANAIGLELSLSSATLLFLLASATNLIPITPNGLGVREGLNVWFLNSLGFTVEAALSFSLLSLVIRVVTCLPAVPFMQFKPKAGTPPETD
jgi:glycosyltransferase 2 family protein